MKYTIVVATIALLGASIHGAPIVTTGILSSETVATPSPGTGSTIVTYDPAAHTLRVQAEFSGVLGPTTACHIHAPTPPSGAYSVATQTPSFIGFPLGVTAGTFDQTYDLTQASSFRAGYIAAHGGSIAAAEAAFVASLVAGTSYLNVHTTVVPGGEIRAFLEVDSDIDFVPDADDAFPNSRDVGGTVHIDDCDTGVDNVVFDDGSTLSDLIDEVADGAQNHGKFVSGVAALKNEWRKTGVVSAEDAEAIQDCAAASSLP